MKKTHLVVFVHGMAGARTDSAYPSKQLTEKYPDIEIFSSTINEKWSMNDGVDACGLRLAQEIYDHIVHLQMSQSITVTRFSIFGHSMGGLLARFAIGVLDRQNVFKNIELMSFTSFASPHLGVYLTQDIWYSHFVNGIVRKAGCPTTDQITLIDTFRDGKPLFEVLSDPKYEFFTALAKFKHKRSYANTRGDYSVAYYTSALDPSDHFDDDLNMEIICDPEYPSIIKQFDIKEVKPVQMTTSIEKVLLIAAFCIVIPAFFIWPKAKHWCAHTEVVSKYADKQDGYYSIHLDKKKHAFLFQDVQKEAKEAAAKELERVALFNPMPGPNIKSRIDYELKCLPVQRKILQNLNGLPWERILVRIDSLRSHVLIMGMVENTQEGRDVVKHFVDTFDF